MTTRVLILWSDNSAANLGLRVLAQGNAALVRSALGHDTEVDCQDFGPGDSDVSFGTRSIVKDLFRGDGPIKTKLRQYDLLLDSGAGDSFADIYGLKRLMFIAYTHWIARRLGIPLILGPQTIGPFKTVTGRFAARRSLRQAEIVMARDAASAEYAESVLSRRADAVGSDVVFLLPGETERPIGRDVIVNVSGLLWFADDHGSSERYRAEIRRLIDGLLAAGRSVSLLAHVVHSPSGNDDIDAIDDLLRSGAYAEVEVLIPETLDDARRLIRSGTILVGARMHACLNALSQGVPALPWAYSRKFAPLMRAIGWESVIDLRSTRDPAEETLRAILDSGNLQRLSQDAAECARRGIAEMSPYVATLRNWAAQRAQLDGGTTAAPATVIGTGS